MAGIDSGADNLIGHQMEVIEYEEDVAPEPFDILELLPFYNFMKPERSGGRVIMKSVERNAPCVCGSGKKQKKCCREFNGRRYHRLLRTVNDAPDSGEDPPRKPMSHGLGAFVLGACMLGSGHADYYRPLGR